MAALIVCSSTAHGNTRKVADVLVATIGGVVVSPGDVDPAMLDQYDLIGFGSGVRFARFYRDLLQLVDGIPARASHRAFVFSTSGFGWRYWNRGLIKRLEQKGFTIVGDFTCKGLDTMGPFKLFGGLNKDRPNADDLRAAEQFACSLIAVPPHQEQ
jgi:flavodoxin